MYAQYNRGRHGGRDYDRSNEERNKRTSKTGMDEATILEKVFLLIVQMLNVMM